MKKMFETSDTGPHTFAHATAITILAPAFAMPLASDLDPTYSCSIERESLLEAYAYISIVFDPLIIIFKTKI
jgi:hypothetical protein